MSVAQIRVLEGPDRGVTLDLPLGRRVLVGRGDDADLCLHDANVSRRHCTLEHRLAGIYVQDLKSRGGTVLNGEHLVGSGQLAPDTADVSLGGTRLEIVRATATEPFPVIPGVEIKRQLGTGGSGTVFEGVILSTRAKVAVKLLALDADDVARRRFEREAALRGKLDHPAIARIYDLRRIEGRPCLIRELVEGLSLEQHLDRRGPLPWRDTVWIGGIVGEALAHAHSRGIVHRDVKPGNIILGIDNRQPKLIDFDLAKRLPTAIQGSLTRLTETGEGLGSLSYLAPEQLTGARDVSVSADVYGLGMTLYHAVTGRRPFSDVAPEDFIDALYQSGPRPLRQFVPSIPPPVLQVLERAYARTEGERFPDAPSFVAALRQLLA